MLDRDFWNGRRVLLTGHTGFKGSWMMLLLERLGAEVFGIALPPDSTPSLYEVLAPWPRVHSTFCDIREREPLDRAVRAAEPEIVLHLAAQSLVRESYRRPVDTIETNAMGTVYLLESLRAAPSLRAVLIVTSDKVYEADATTTPRSETSRLGGHDPYSASKAVAELLVDAYSRSFFADRGIAVRTARAGNVIGGGDWAADRIVPDLWRAYERRCAVELRHPRAVRPWQHVLDPLLGYLLYVQQMCRDANGLPRALNFGPATDSLTTVQKLAEDFAAALGAEHLWAIGEPDARFRESEFLAVDASLATACLGWRPGLNVDEAIRWTCEWYKAFRDGSGMRRFSHQQIDAYLELAQRSESHA